MLYPYKTVPIFEDYIWGGTNLKRLGKNAPDGIVAESWELSTLPGHENIIANGPDKGLSLKKLIERHGRLILGHNINESKKDVPFLLKYIDANDRLSIQVHPDDNYALCYENGQPGKTEMWYILEAKPKATILHGFKEGLGSHEIKEAISNQQYEHVYREIHVKKGDIVYIPAGTVHALNDGIIVAEIQQHSNLTYRIFDYGRMDKQGKKRPLHIEKALDVMSYKNTDALYSGLTINSENCSARYLTLSKYFCVRELKVQGSEIKFRTGSNFHAYMIIQGKACFRYAGKEVYANELETILIPAGLECYHIEGNFTALHIFVPYSVQQELATLIQAGYKIEQICDNVAGIDGEAVLKQVV